jgi:hypothetical protein
MRGVDRSDIISDCPGDFVEIRTQSEAGHEPGRHRLDLVGAFTLAGFLLRLCYAADHLRLRVPGPIADQCTRFGHVPRPTPAGKASSLASRIALSSSASVIWLGRFMTDIVLSLSAV